MTASSTRLAVLTLYRDVLRVARYFPDRRMGRKLQYNAKELLRLRQHEQCASRIQMHLVEGREALQVYEVLQNDPDLLTAITRKKRPMTETSE